MKPEDITVITRTHHWSPTVKYFKIRATKRKAWEQIYLRRALNPGSHVLKAPRPCEPRSYVVKCMYLYFTNYYPGFIFRSSSFTSAIYLPRMQCLQWGEMSSR
jgi:hypothetical protein